MRILALNSGSSSIKCAMLDLEAPAQRVEVRVEGIGGAAALVIGSERRSVGTLNYQQATDVVLRELAGRMASFWPTRQREPFLALDWIRSGA